MVHCFRSILSLVALALCSVIVAEAKPTPKTYNCGEAQQGTVTADAVNKAYAAAPNRVDKGLSGYPHVFGNEEGLQFPSEHCRNVPKGAVRLELPTDAKGTAYPWDKKRSGEPPPYRIVYLVSEVTGNKRFLCGLMAHPKNGTPEEKRKFKLCTPPAAFQSSVEPCQDGGQCPLVEPNVFFEDEELEEEDEF